ncbi:primosomal protein N' [Salinibacterium sp. G-O1]|uniref:primosomal protein N' family DNA-binding protein n=1 Tax=Salinibacterium sp. G-O1 TaxID=3046208 RepID=UPI0024B98E2B|nr:primosomal protein N' [Salinibacterium sp. G-O1]MDJ0335180.1 primosomal protein N' [Salinibacterium sp. G-O1]
MPTVSEAASAGALSVAKVLIDSPLPQLDRLFDYGIPGAMVEAAMPGVRVRVPLRSAGRVADGIIVEVSPRGDYAGVLSELDSVVSPIKVLTPEVWALARRAADRASGSATDIVRLAVPKRQVRVETAFLAADTPPDGEPVTAVPIDAYGPGVLEGAIAANERLAIDAVPLVREVHPLDADPSWAGGWAVTMAAAAAATIAAGRSAILAVPDYRDQEQLQSALAAVLPASSIVRLDARQSNPDRYRAFLRCLQDDPVAIIGNRSVIYAPASKLGLIALWDDGDPLHSEPLSPYVHARDAALLRQEQQSCALMFFGHSRSTEVERLVEIGWVRSVSPRPLQLPKVIPTSQQSSNDRLAAQARIPSSAWKIARTALETGPVLVQVARPGYAPRLACAECQQTARCMRCEGPLLQKSARSTPACTWCGALAAAWKCQHCEGEKLRFVGNGSSRTAEDLGRAFPGIRVIVADGDHPVQTVGSGPALVIATRGAEPIAAGGYRAVLLLDGEQMAARESLRVGEDCLRWWSNAVALAAGGAPTVLVGVGGTLASTLVTWRQADFARAELADRRSLRFPPAIRVATVTGSVDAVSAAVAASGIAGSDVLGPVDLEPPLVRTILRFDYAHGAEVAAALRSELIRSATSRRKRTGSRQGYAPAAPSLRIRLDDVEPFLES